MLYLTTAHVSAQTTGTGQITDLLKTHEVKFNAITAQGELQGCSLEFNALIADASSGVPVTYFISGSVGLNYNNTRDLLIGVKLVTAELKKTPGKLEPIPRRPHFAYLRSVRGLDNSRSFITSTESPTPGGWFGVFNFDEDFLKILDELGSKPILNFVFNRRKGEIDIVVPVDLTVKSIDEMGRQTRDDEMFRRFTLCTIGMSEDWLKRKGIGGKR